MWRELPTSLRPFAGKPENVSKIELSRLHPLRLLDLQLGNLPFEPLQLPFFGSRLAQGVPDGTQKGADQKHVVANFAMISLDQSRRGVLLLGTCCAPAAVEKHFEALLNVIPLESQSQQPPNLPGSPFGRLGPIGQFLQVVCYVPRSQTSWMRFGF